MTKLYTAALVMQQVEKGRISLDDTRQSGHYRPNRRIATTPEP
jgi:D-alanyl-D-alanine carboxypeptidase